MIAYKLFRLRPAGLISPLFVGREFIVPVGQWLFARDDLPHPGLQHRPGFHCCAAPYAPHLKMVLRSGERRVWYRVSIEDYVEVHRPGFQGGLWYLARRMKVLGQVDTTISAAKMLQMING